MGRSNRSANSYDELRRRLGAQEAGEGSGEAVRIGRYVVLRTLGAGAMGLVVLAYDPELDRNVALKLVRPEAWQAGSRGWQRLRREAQAMARLSHPNVVAVHDVGTVGDGQLFVAMEYVEGVTLKEWLYRERPTWQQALETILKAGHGLAAAHQAGFIHRDFKPDNVLVANDGRVCVTDFGLVRTAEDDDASLDSSRSGVERSAVERSKDAYFSDSDGTPELTATGAVIGTPAYMSPEQHKGKGDIDERADQFAFCVTLYQAVYGERPFPGKDRRSLGVAVTTGRINPPPSGSKVPGWLRTLLLRGLEVEPEKRFPTMEALLGELERDRVGRRRTILSLAAVASVAAVVGAGAITAFGVGEESGDPCARAAAALDDVWNEPVKEQIRTAFVATGRTFAEETFGRVSASLDDYSEAWSTQRVATCRATHVTRQQSESLLDLKMTCLDRRLAEMNALVGLFTGEVDGAVVEKAAMAVHELQELESCDDGEALREVSPLPDDPAARKKIAEDAAVVDRATALRRIGKFKEGVELLEPILPAMTERGHAPLTARAHFEVAHMNERLGKAEEAVKQLRQAVHFAYVAHDDQQAAEAHNFLVFVSGYHLSRFDAVDELDPIARSAVARAGDSDKLLGTYYCNVASVEYSRGNYKKSLDWFRRGLPMREKGYGIDHPTLAATYGSASEAARALGQIQLSLDYMERAQEIVRTQLGAGHPRMAMLLLNVANIEFTSGRLEDATSSYGRALEAVKLGYGEGHPYVGVVHNNRGEAFLKLERAEQSLAEHEKALASFSESVGADHVFYGHALLGRGLAQAALGRRDQAFKNYEAAKAILDTKGDPHTRGKLHFARARLLWEKGQRAEAKALASEALSLLETAGEAARDERTSLLAWVAEH